ncbi:hypothetical protein H1C71_015095, partial [Ictidomys tridecemlineatus]
DQRYPKDAFAGGVGPLLCSPGEQAPASLGQEDGGAQPESRLLKLCARLIRTCQTPGAPSSNQQQVTGLWAKPGESTEEPSGRMASPQVLSSVCWGSSLHS